MSQVALFVRRLTACTTMVIATMTLTPASTVLAQPCPASGWTQLQSSTGGVTPRRTSAWSSETTRGKVVLFGGSGVNGPLGDTWVFNGSTWSPVESEENPEPRVAHAMAFDPVRGKTVLFGGLGNSGLLGDTWEWDGTSWTPINVAGPVARSGHSMAFDPVTSRVILVGGDGVDVSSLVAETWAWDGTAWTQVQAFGPQPTSGAALVTDTARSRLVFFGGVDPATFDLRTVTWEFDGTAWLVSPAATTPPSRSEPGMTYDPVRQRTVLFGGGSDADGLTWEYDGLDWTSVASSPAGLRSGPLGYDTVNGSVVRLQPEPSRTWRWNGSSWSTQGPVFSPATNAHAMTYDTARGQIIRFGGTTLLGTAVNGLWGWTGSTWNLLSESGPSARDRASLAFDTQRGRAILFGGADADFNPLGDTWVWNGTSWAQLNVPGPTPRQGAAMYYDPARDRVVLFGGLNEEFERIGDTWEFNGTSWTQITPTTSPIGRDRAGMAFHAGLGRIVLFGGRDANFENSNELWQYDGSTWSLIAANGPTGRGDLQFAYDAGSGTLVAHGGIDADFAVSSETWLWRAATGWQALGGSSVGPRTAGAMVYDPASQRSILFGGFDESNTRSDTWSVASGLTVRFTQQPTGASVLTGETITLVASAVSPTLSGISWLRDGIEVSNGTTPEGAVISGATTGTLTITNATLAVSGTYRCVATDACTTVLSGTARVQVSTPPVVRCSPADIAYGDGEPLPPFGAPGGFNPAGPDGGDFDCFFNFYFAPEPDNAVCDIAYGDGEPLPPFGLDGGFNPGVDGGDFDCFFNFYFNGCV